jgi:hypothetical protein
MAVWLKTQGLYILLQLASNFLLAVRAEGLKYVRPIVICNFSVASRVGHAASASNFSVAATENLRLRALSYKAVFSIRATK